MSDPLELLKQQAAAELEKELHALARNGNAVAHLADTAPLFVPVSLTQLMQRPPKQWLFDCLIGVGDLAMIFGESGSGKTFVTFDLMVAGAMGVQFAGQFTPARPLKIGYCAGEGVSGLAGRATAVINKYGIRPDDLPLAFFENVPELFDQTAPGNVARFIADLSQQTWDVIVIDTLHTAATGADENGVKDMGVVLRSAKRVRDALNCTVLIIHHANKNGDYRGTTALKAAMDTMLQTESRQDGYGALKCFKQKDAAPFAPVDFRIVPDSYSGSAFVSWGEKHQPQTWGDRMLVAMQAAAGVKMSATGWGQTVGIAANHANNTLAKLAEAGEVLSSLPDASKPAGKGNTRLYWLAA